MFVTGHSSRRILSLKSSLYARSTEFLPLFLINYPTNSGHPPDNHALLPEPLHPHGRDRTCLQPLLRMSHRLRQHPFRPLRHRPRILYPHLACHARHTHCDGRQRRVNDHHLWYQSPGWDFHTFVGRGRVCGAGDGDWDAVVAGEVSRIEDV